jgi:hypothetical protein
LTAKTYEERFRAGREQATRNRWPRLRIAHPGLARIASLAAQAWLLLTLLGPGIYAAVQDDRSTWWERLLGAVVGGPLLLLLCYRPPP